MNYPPISSIFVVTGAVSLAGERVDLVQQLA